MASGLGVRAELMAADDDLQYGQIGVTYRLGIGSRKPVAAAARKPATVTPPRADVNLAEATPPAAPPIVAEIPAPAPREVITRMPAFSDVVNFASDSAQLTNGAKTVLRELASRVKSFDDAKLTLTAHTDNRGSLDYNQRLSERRAQSVRRYLAIQGIKQSAIRVSAVGETRPTDTNATAAGRYINRRVEVYAGAAGQQSVAQ
ncbi:MAG: OmpA family protein, partial [Pseudomonadota bacterium]